MTSEPTTRSTEQAVESHLQWVLRRPASVIRWLSLILIFMVTLLAGPFLALPLQLVLPDSEFGDLVGNLAPFVGYLVVFGGLAALILRRPPWMFAFRRRSPEWGLFGIAIALQLVLSAVEIVGLNLLGIVDFEFHAPDLTAVLVLVPLAVVGIAVQAGTEEFIVRGALMQMVFRMTSQAWLVILLPAIAFAALHVSNLPEGAGVVAYLPYFSMGLVWGWIAWRTGSIWFTWGLHYANNAFNAVLVGNPDDVYTPVSGLYAHVTTDSDTLIALPDVFGALVTAVVVWFLLRRRPNAGAIARADRRAAVPRDDDPEPVTS
jgi:membrane protease YdiL (CAAX protease family)